MDQPSDVASPTRRQLAGQGKYVFLFPLAPENAVSRDGFGRCSPASALPVVHTGAFTHGVDSSRSARLNLAHRLPSTDIIDRVSPEVYQVSQLCTDGVHCREFARTGPVFFMVGSSTGDCLFRLSHPWSNICAPLFCHTRY